MMNRLLVPAAICMLALTLSGCNGGASVVDVPGAQQPIRTTLSNSLVDPASARTNSATPPPGELLVERGANNNGPIIYAANSAWGSAMTGYAGANGGYGLVGYVANTTTSATSTGVFGIAQGPKGTGVYGESASSENAFPGYGVIATSHNGNGLFANTLRGDMAAAVIENTAPSGLALQAVGAGNAIVAQSSSSNGAIGQTRFNSGLSGAGFAGLFGQDLSNDQGIGNAGVAGTTASGFGVSGTSTGDGTGVGGFSTTGIALFGSSTNNLAVYGESPNSIAVEGYSGSNIGMIAESEATPDPTDPSHVNGPPALQVVTTSGAPAIKVTSFSGDIMSVDTNGILIISGNLTVDGNVSVAGKTGTCPSCPAPLTRSRSDSMEDMGEGQLISGQAYVRFDQAFAAALHSSSGYLVFITPQGESRGLYVTQKSEGGFAVRETDGGRSNVAFDYRVVTRPRGAGVNGATWSSREIAPLHTPATTLRLARNPFGRHVIRRSHHTTGFIPQVLAVPTHER